MFISQFPVLLFGVIVAKTIADSYSTTRTALPFADVLAICSFVVFMSFATLGLSLDSCLSFVWRCAVSNAPQPLVMLPFIPPSALATLSLHSISRDRLKGIVLGFVHFTVHFLVSIFVYLHLAYGSVKLKLFNTAMNRDRILPSDPSFTQSPTVIGTSCLNAPVYRYRQSHRGHRGYVVDGSDISESETSALLGELEPGTSSELEESETSSEFEEPEALTELEEPEASAGFMLGEPEASTGTVLEEPRASTESETPVEGLEEDEENPTVPLSSITSVPLMTSFFQELFDAYTYRRILRAMSRNDETHESTSLESVRRRLIDEWAFIAPVLIGVMAVDVTAFGFNATGTWLVVEHRDSNLALYALAASAVTAALGLVADIWFLCRCWSADTQSFEAFTFHGDGDFGFFSIKSRVPLLFTIISVFSILVFTFAVTAHVFQTGIVLFCVLFLIMMFPNRICRLSQLLVGVIMVVTQSLRASWSSLTACLITTAPRDVELTDMRSNDVPEPYQSV